MSAAKHNKLCGTCVHGERLGTARVTYDHAVPDNGYDIIAAYLETEFNILFDVKSSQAFNVTGVPKETGKVVFGLTIEVHGH